MKKDLKLFTAGVLTAMMLTLSFCQRPGVQDGPQVPDSITNANNASAPDNTVRADTINQVDTTNRSDTTQRMQ